jgi:hypothetical protein
VEPVFNRQSGVLVGRGGGGRKLAKLAKLILIRFSEEILTGFATFASCFLNKYFLTFCIPQGCIRMGCV